MLKLTNIRKTFGSLVAVDGLSLSVAPGEVFGLLGPNGAGKTTTLSMAVGLLQPDSGDVLLDQFGSPTEPPVRARIGVAPQELALYDYLSADENLAFFGSLYGLRGSNLKERSAAVLAAVGLESRSADRVSGFSGGMKRRLNLAAALLHDPPLILLDEPTAGVDPQSRNSIIELVGKLKAEGRTVIYTTHYMEEAQRLCDRVAIMDKGRLLALGTVDELTTQHGGKLTLSITRGENVERLATDDPTRELTRILAATNAQNPVDNIHIEKPSLESVFLNLTGRTLRD